MNMAEYNGVWVFAEQRNGELQKVSLEILGEAQAKILLWFYSNSAQTEQSKY